MPPIIKFRPGQQEVFWCELRVFFLLWRRQYGKSFTLMSRALRRMMERPNHLVTLASASVALGEEAIRKEVEVWRIVMDAFRKQINAEGKLKLETSADDDHGELLDIDALCDLFEHQRLETRIKHGDGVISRTRVIAPNPDTAVGWTGDVYMDEVGRIPDLKAIFEAVEPFMDSNPELEMIMATTPPPDDKHYSFELFLPPDQEWPVKPEGNWYRAPCGIMVHRLDAYDGAAGGAKYFHRDTREIITPDEHRALAFDKSAWDRNHGCHFLQGGTAALSLAAIQRAMSQGRGQCLGNDITEGVAA